MSCGRATVLTPRVIQKYRRSLSPTSRRSDVGFLEDILPYLKCHGCHRREMKMRTLETEPSSGSICDRGWWTVPHDFD
jgi:hypothetical protein